MKARAIAVLIVTAIFAGLISGFSDRVNAQGDIPAIQAITLYGDVTISGGANPNGMKIIARIGDSWESEPVIVGEQSENRYVGLFINPPEELIGLDIVFWLEDQAKADEKTLYAFIDQDGRTIYNWNLPQLRQQNLSFPFAPVPTATPTPTPTATPVIVEPSFYEGRVRTGSLPPADGTLIYAVIGDYVSPFAEVFQGTYFLTLDPVFDEYEGLPIEFYIGETKALQKDTFVSGSIKESFLLAFPQLPPTPTPTPPATPTPEPSRTPTPTPTAKPVATATPTPTPIGDVTATAEARATATAVAEEATGGSCSAREGGPASVGNLGLVLAPLALLAWRRFNATKGM